MYRRMVFVALLSFLLLTPSRAFAQEFEFFPGATYDPSVPTLEQVVGHNNGARITMHGEAERYLHALAEASPKVQLVRFGETWEGRALYYLIVTSEANQARVEEIKAGMQRLADPRTLSDAEATQLIESLPSITWLSYGVHGNEISSTDAGLLLAYHLAAAQNDALVDEILNNSIVIIDPMQNPDGRDRFINYFRQTRGPAPDADQQAAEHNEVWPSGRMNHYLFDMNRDWFALTQKESRARVRVYQEWFPQVFVDLHEMGSNASYYFAPPADPASPHVTQAQHDWLRRFGQNNSKWFDRFRFDYFTREVFDSFYSGYGESWPTMHGSIGMTFEQASSRGLKVKRSDKTTMLYRDTVQHHFISSLSTAETVAKNRAEMLRYFYDFRRTAIEEGRREVVKEYILPPGRDPNRTAKLARLLAAQGVEVLEAREPFSNARVRPFDGGAAVARKFPSGTFVISLAQPAKRVIRSLLDREVPQDDEFIKEQLRRNEKRLPDQMYDVTAWSLPLLYNVEVFAAESTSRLGAKQPLAASGQNKTEEVTKAHLAYLIPWGHNSTARVLADLLRQKIRVFTTGRKMKLNGVTFPPGSLIIKVKDNPGDLHERLAAVSAKHGAQIYPTDRAWVDEGINIGSNNVRYLEPPRIALAWNDPTHPYSAGWARYVLEQMYGLPVTLLRVQQLSSTDLSKYNVLILPNTRGSGSAYSRALGERGTKQIKTWVEQGGTLITLGNATHWLTGEKVGLLSTQREFKGGAPERSKPKEKKKDDNGEPTVEPEQELPSSTPGAMLRVQVDGEFWPGFGYDGETVVLVEGRNIFTPLKLDKGRNIARFVAEDRLVASGFTYEAKRKQLANKAYLMHQRHGRGHVLAFAGEPNYRAYFDGLNLLFLNGVFFGPSH